MKVYKSKARGAFFGFSLIAADSAHDANCFIDAYRCTVPYGDWRGYSEVTERDCLTYLNSDKEGIILYGIFENH